MNDRRQYALTHPLSRAVLDSAALGPYTGQRKHATGLLIMTILAVDR